MYTEDFPKVFLRIERYEQVLVTSKQGSALDYLKAYWRRAELFAEGWPGKTERGRRSGRKETRGF